MTDNGAAPTLIEQFSKVIVHKADNRDFFEWSVVRNGMLMPAPWLLDLERPRPPTTDFNDDGKTDFVDFFLFADAYGGTDPRFDLDGSGTVDFVDFFKFVDAFGS